MQAQSNTCTLLVIESASLKEGQNKRFKKKKKKSFHPNCQILNFCFCSLETSSSISGFAEAAEECVKCKT